MKRILLAALCTLAFTASPLAPPQAFEIRLDRPLKAGQRFKVSVTAHQLQEMSVESAGKKVRNDRKEFDVEYSGEETILEVGSNGKVVKASHQIETLLKISDGKKKSLLDKGTVVVAFQREKKPVFEIAGVAAADDMAEALAVVMETSDPDTAGDDEMFGTRDRKKVGEKWKIDGEKFAARSLKDYGLRVTEVSGEFILKESIPTTAGENLVITGVIKGKPNLPISPGFTLKESTMEVKLSGIFPADSSLPRREESEEITFQVVATGKPKADGPEVEFKTLMQRSSKRERTILK